MSRTTNAVVRAMTRRRNPAPEAIEGDFAQAVARRLESREIVRVPGLPVDDPEPEWFDVAIEHLRRQQELAAEREARREAEEEAQNTPQNTASILMGEIAKAATGSGSTTIPLNGAAVLRAVLNGGNGTVNGLRP
jgi:hypothetical protein